MVPDLKLDEIDVFTDLLPIDDGAESTPSIRMHFPRTEDPKMTKTQSNSETSLVKAVWTPLKAHYVT